MPFKFLHLLATTKRLLFGTQPVSLHHSFLLKHSRNGLPLTYSSTERGKNHNSKKNHFWRFIFYPKKSVIQSSEMKFKFSISKEAIKFPRFWSFNPLSTVQRINKPNKSKSKICGTKIQDLSDPNSFLNWKHYIQTVSSKNFTTFIEDERQNSYLKNFHHRGYELSLFKVKEAIFPCKWKDLRPRATQFFLYCKLKDIHYHYLSVIFGENLFNKKVSTVFTLTNSEKHKQDIQKLQTIFKSGIINEMFKIIEQLIKLGSWNIEIYKQQLRVWFPYPFDKKGIKETLNYIGLKKSIQLLSFGQKPYQKWIKEIKIFNDIDYRTDLVNFIQDINDSSLQFGR